MNYNATVRKEIKAEQKGIVRAHLGRIIGAQMLYTLPMMLIAIISVVAMVGEMGAMRSAVEFGMAPTSGAASGLTMLVYILELVIGAPLMLGLMQFYIRLMRGEEPSASTVFQPFTSLRAVWRGIRMSLCLFVRGLIWMLAPIFVFSTVFTAILFGSMYSSTGMTTGLATSILVLYLLLLVALLFISAKLATYRAGYVRLHDNEHIGTWDATREGSNAFRGRFKDVIAFFLSFAPWYLLYIVLACVSFVPAGMAFVNAGDEIGIAVVGGLALSLVLFFIVSLTLGAFLGSYQEMSFLRLFERLAPAPEETPDFTAFQVNPNAPVAPTQVPAQEPAPAPEAPAEEAPASEAPAEQPAAPQDEVSAPQQQTEDGAQPSQDEEGNEKL